MKHSRTPATGIYTRNRAPWPATAGLAYLLLPNLLFFAGWLRLPLAVVLCALCLWAFFLFYRDGESAGTSPERAGHHQKFLLGMALMALLWCLLSGTGGFFYQHGDYDKHNAIVKDLMLNPWPVLYPPGRYITETTFLNYYLGWYLPTALAGKAGGVPVAEVFAWLWSALGVFLFLANWTALAPARRRCMLLIFPLLGGLEALPGLYRSAQVAWHFGFGEMFTEVALSNTWEGALLINWGSAARATNFTMDGNLKLLFWQPQHAISGWLGTVLLLRQGWQQRNSHSLFFILSLTMLWSSFVALGMAPLVLFMALRNGLKRALTFQNLVAGVAVAATLLAWYLAHLPVSPKGFIFEFVPPDTFALLYPLFVLVEFGLFAALLHPLLPRSQRPLWYVCLAVLLLLPFYKLGYYNDFLTRTSIPALLAFWYLLAAHVPLPGRGKGVRLFLKGRNWRVAALYLCLLVAALNPLRYFAVNIASYFTDVGFVKTDISLKNIDSVTTIEFREVIARQYMGETGSFFFSYLASKPDEKPVARPRKSPP